MKQNNNFDQSSTGVNIETTACYDTTQAQWLFTDNFKQLVTPIRYQQDGEWFYSDFDNTSPDDYAISFTVKDQKALKDFMRDNEYKDETIKEIVEYDYNLDEICNYSKLVDEFPFLDFVVYHTETKDFVHYNEYGTRGYSQGDYAKVYYIVPFGETCNEKALHDEIDRLFWDAPIYGRVYINDIEFAYDEYDLNTYEWDKSGFIDCVVKDYAKRLGLHIKGSTCEYIKETLENLLPENPEYN